MNASPETLLCGCTSGAIFVRPCARPAMTQCVRCQCPLCREHARPESPSIPAPDLVPAPMLCPACYAESRRDTAADDDDGMAWSAVSSRHTRWHDNSGSRGHSASMTPSHYADDAEATSDEPFNSEDYDAFDAVSDYDKDAERGDGFDS
ncbi:hypothetical protein [Methylomagnum sp.]